MNKTISGQSFVIVNKNGEAILYKTDKPDYNVLTLTFTNLTGAPLTLTGGSPVRIRKGASENQERGKRKRNRIGLQFQL